MAFVELVAFALGGPTAPSGVERRSFESSAQGSGKAVDVWLGLGLGLIRGLVAEFLTAVSPMYVVPTEEKTGIAVMRSHSEVEGQ